MDEIEKLRNIWDNIPKVKSNQIDFSQKEIIDRHIDLFSIGDCFYIIFNTQTATIEFTSPNVKKVLGYTESELQTSMLLGNIHPDDLPYYFHYEQSAVRFFLTLPEELFFQYKFSYDYRIKIKDGSYKRILQQVIPIYYFPEGGARTIGIFTDLTHLNLQGIPRLSFIGMQGAPSYYNIHLKEEFVLANNLFSNKEKEILSYVVQGLTSEAIAHKVHRSIHTIRTHRKNILEKSGCDNLQELIVKSIREGWV